MNRIFLLIAFLLSVGIVAALGNKYISDKESFHSPYTTQTDSIKNNKGKTMTGKVIKTDEEWKKELTPEQYFILRQKGTERAFTGKYYDLKEDGIYRCAACGNELFSSDTKYDSGSGWPSYWAPIDEGKIELVEDNSLGMRRIEVVCGRCGGHLGHVFDDGPKPTGKRYCINSAALQFEKKDK